MKVNKGITIRVKPNAAQRDSLSRHFGRNRFLWNHFLAKRNEDYRSDKTGSDYYKDAALLTQLKRQPEYAWLYEASTNSQQRTLKYLADAFRRFFKGHARFPNFKSKRYDQVFTLAGGISVRENRICLPKFKEGLKFNRKLPNFTKINKVRSYAVMTVRTEVGRCTPGPLLG